MSDFRAGTEPPVLMIHHAAQTDNFTFQVYGLPDGCRNHGSPDGLRRHFSAPEQGRHKSSHDQQKAGGKDVKKRSVIAFPFLAKSADVFLQALRSPQLKDVVTDFFPNPLDLVKFTRTLRTTFQMFFNEKCCLAIQFIIQICIEKGANLLAVKILIHIHPF